MAIRSISEPFFFTDVQPSLFVAPGAVLAPCAVCLHTRLLVPVAETADVVLDTARQTVQALGERADIACILGRVSSRLLHVFGGLLRDLVKGVQVFRHQLLGLDQQLDRSGSFVRCHVPWTFFIIVDSGNGAKARL